MSRYQNFIFKNYTFDQSAKTLILNYSFDNQLNLSETYRFDFEFDQISNPKALERALQSLFFMAGVSYYKAFVPSQIIIEQGSLDKTGADFFAKTYQKGLGEFFFVNQLDPKLPINFPANNPLIEPLAKESSSKGLLIGIGGGKDSLVSVELLRNQSKVATWSVGHRPQLTPLVQKIGLPHFWVEREWDRSLLDVNKQGAYNGHVPISAIIACVGSVVALLSGYRDVVVSNESSASDPNLYYRGEPINHQYSKSLEFEQDYQSYVERQWADDVRYYSILRPLSEVRIAELFAEFGFEKYKNVFSSCNRAFTHISDQMFWCGECPKCAFTFLLLAPFVPKEDLTALFDGKNLLADSALEPTYRQLLGIEGHKPLDCVGEVKEARTAMRMAQQNYPGLDKYIFELPDDYDYKKLGGHSMPSEIYKLVEPKFKS